MSRAPDLAVAPCPADPLPARRLRDRIDAAETALRNVALGRPNVLELLEAGAERIGDALGAGVAVALIGEALSDDYVRCAVWPPATPVALVDLAAGDWPDLQAGRAVVADRRFVAEGVGLPHVLLLPIQGSVSGTFALGRTAPWRADEGAAGERLAVLFSTLLAWSESEARFQRTVADLDDALFTFGHEPDGRRAYVFVTPQAEAIAGLDPDAIMAGDADWAALVVEEDRPAFAVHDARLRAGEPSRVDVRLRLEEGDVVWVCERATPSVDAAGRPVAGGLLSDVTAQKEAEAQIERARRAAERAAQTRMAFLRTMSHELRTPLGAIRGFAELLGEEVTALDGAPPEIAEFAGTIRDASDRALRLVGDLLDLSRLETGALDLQDVPLDLRAVVEAACSRYRSGLECQGVGLRVEAPAEPAVVLGDPARVDQIVDQLLSNAAKFTPSGAVAVRLAASEGRVRLEVEDTGVGIAADVLESMFEPFVQEDARVNRAFEGTGLGLAIASRLADRMGGRLEARSVKGEGSTFTLTLPAAE